MWLYHLSLYNIFTILVLILLYLFFGFLISKILKVNPFLIYLFVTSPISSTVYYFSNNQAILLTSLDFLTGIFSVIFGTFLFLFSFKLFNSRIYKLSKAFSFKTNFNSYEGILAFSLLFTRIITSLLAGPLNINNDSRLLSSSGFINGLYFSFFNLVTLSFLIYSFDNLVTTNSIINKDKILSYFYIFLYIVSLFLFSAAGGSKAALAKIFDVVWILSFYLGSIGVFAKNLLINYKIKKEIIFGIILGLITFVFSISYLPYIFRRGIYLITYFVVSPIECLSALHNGNQSIQNLIGLNYIQTLLEPLHKFNLYDQINVGNTLNNNLPLLPDNEFGGTNPSVFCWSYNSSILNFISSHFVGFVAFGLTLTFLYSLIKHIKYIKSFSDNLEGGLTGYKFLNPTLGLYLNLIFTTVSPLGTWVEYITNFTYNIFVYFFLMMILTFLKR